MPDRRDVGCMPPLIGIVAVSPFWSFPTWRCCLPACTQCDSQPRSVRSRSWPGTMESASPGSGQVVSLGIRECAPGTWRVFRDTGAHDAVTPHDATLLLVKTTNRRLPRLDVVAVASMARKFASTLVLGLIFSLLAVVVYARAADRAGARAFAWLFISTALALTLVWPLWLGHAWALSLEFVMIASWGSVWANFFLTFPRPSSLVVPVRIALLAVPAGAVAVVYTFAVLVDVAWYPVAEVLRGVVVLGGIGVGCARLAWALRWSQVSHGRPLLMTLTLGSVVGVAPFLLGTLVPSMLDDSPLLPPQVSILPIALLPLSFAYAIVRHHLFGTTVRVRRALAHLVVALAIGACAVLLALVAAQWGMPFVGKPGLAIVGVALGMLAVVATPLAWKVLDRLAFADVYDEWRMLHDLTTALARLHDPHEMGDVLCRRLVCDMAASFAAILTITDISRDILASTHPFDDASGGALRDEAASVMAAHPMGLQEGMGGPVALWVPLHTSDATHGVVALGPKHNGEPFNGTDRRLLHAIAGTAAAALHGAELSAQLHRRAVQLDSLTQQLVAVHEEERRALARDLHDGPLSRLVHITHLLATADAGIPRDLVWRQSVAATVELRALCNGLRASVLDDLGLADAIEALVEERRPTGNVTLRFRADDDAYAVRLFARAEDALYNVAREALTNALRHAGASEVAVRLAVVGGAPHQRVHVSVTDDGRGFAVPAEPLSLTCAGHYGLAGMIERVRGAGGVCELRSAIGDGTEIVAEVPL